MDPDKIVSFVSNNLANQTSGIVATLYHPRVIFEPVRPAVGAVAVVGGGTVTPGAMIEKPAPEVFVFFAINLLLGTAINKLIPGRKEAPDIIPTLCVSYGIALMAGFLLHLFSRALGGRGTFWMTFSAYAQVASTLFLLSSFTALLWGSIISLPRLGDFLTQQPAVGFFAENPVSVFFVMQALLQMIYMPVALVAVHGFEKWKGAIITTVFAVTGVLLSVMLYLMVGMLTFSARPSA